MQIILTLTLIFLSIEDIAYFKIRNEGILFIIVLIIVKYITCGLPNDYFAHFIYSLLVFGFIVAVYAMGFFGGGDAKLLPLAFLWLDTDAWFSFYVSLTIITIIYIMLYYLNVIPLIRKSSSRKIPYGPCIALAWIISL